LVCVCGSIPASTAAVERHLAQRHEGDVPHFVELLRDGRRVVERLEPVSASLSGRLDERAVFPLCCSEFNSAGETPLAPRELEEGAYLAVLRLGGREARVPFE